MINVILIDDEPLARTITREYLQGYPEILFATVVPGSSPASTGITVVADMSNMGGPTSVAFLDYLKEIPYFIEEVLPRLERLGLRRPYVGG